MFIIIILFCICCIFYITIYHTYKKAFVHITIYLISFQQKLKNSFFIGTHYLFCTILVFAVHFAMFFLVVSVFTPLIIFGEGLCALLSAYLLHKEAGESLERLLSQKVFAGVSGSTVQPDPACVEGFNTYLQRYMALLEVEKTAAEKL